MRNTDSTAKPDRRKKLTPELLAKVHELRNQGLLIKDIALEVGLSKSYVSRVLRGRR